MDEYEKRNQESRDIAAKIIGVFTDPCNMGIALSAFVMSICSVIDSALESTSDKEEAINDVIKNLQVANKNIKERDMKKE